MIMTPKEYVQLQIVEYPGSFKTSDLEYDKLKIYDQLLNVIGNGIDDNNVRNILDKKHIKENTSELFNVYMTEPLYTGNNEDFSIFVNAVLKRDFDKHPDVTIWEESEEHEIGEYSIYPNFQSKYSLIYNTSVFNDNKEWIKEIIWFYKISLIEVEDNRYYSAFPKKNIKDTEKTISDYRERFSKYNSNEEISKAYELEFDGDIEKFITNRWIKDKKEIVKFIKQTILKLEDFL